MYSQEEMNRMYAAAEKQARSMFIFGCWCGFCVGTIVTGTLMSILRALGG